MKLFFISNKLVFRFESSYFSFESTIVLNYFLNRGRANSIVRGEASKQIILELEHDPGRDRLSLVPIRNFLWTNNIPVRPSFKTRHNR